jgi:hemolysin activation/secretion protein
MKTHHILCLTSLLISASLYSEEGSAINDTISAANPVVESSYDDKVIIRDVKGIAVFGSDFNPSDIMKLKAEGVVISEGLDVPNKAAFTELLKKRLHTSIYPDDVDSLSEKLTDFYASHDKGVTSVVVVPQQIGDGVLVVIILEAKVAEIYTTGNKWTPSSWIVKQSGLKKGEGIDLNKLKENLIWINNKFRTVSSSFSPGQNRGETDVVLVTKDRFPISPYIGGDNTGVPQTGRTRWYAGFEAKNLWWDQGANYQFTTGSSSYDFIAHNGSYMIPLPWKHRLLTYGGWGRVHAKVPSPLKHKGIAWQVDARYQAPITKLYDKLFQQLAFGYDFKRTNNNVLYGGSIISNQNADINQFALEYLLNYNDNSSNTEFNLQMFGAPIKMTKYQNNADYDVIRPYAKCRYFYARAKVTHVHNLPMGFSIQGVAAFQGATTNLMPSEQYPLGGYSSVRGYFEDTYLADDAIFFSVEARSPSFRAFAPKRSKTKDKMEVIGFIDYGWGTQNKNTYQERKANWLLGIGPGLRYSVRDNLALRADLGFPLHKIYNHFPYLHVGGTLSY